MKLKLIAMTCLLTFTACDKLPNGSTPGNSPTSMSSMAAQNPETAGVVSVDRFQDGFSTLFKRSGPAFDPVNVSKIVPAPNAPIDLDKHFLVSSLGPKGEKITYYALDVLSDVPGMAWVFLNQKGQPVQGQLPILKSIPGEKDYNDFMQITEVIVPDNYVANSLTSMNDVKNAMSRGEVVFKPGNRIANWAVVPQGTMASKKFQGKPVSGFKAWYQGQVAHYLRFEENLQITSSMKVPTSPIIVIFKNGMDPSMGFKTEANGQTHNVLATLPGDAAYSSLWLHAFQGKAEGFESVNDFMSATLNRGGDLPNLMVNCPVVE